MKPGDTLDGRYTITERLGAGGMGEVYKATHTFLGSSRVIKVVHPHISGNTDAKDRFLREARAATKIQHQNVATLHDFASLPDGAHYMVWEFIAGENLAQRLRTRGTLPPRQAVRITLQALRGLDAIHRAGIIHRDISPENLMITADDEVKIIDLGVAKVEDTDAVSSTRTGIFVGKLRYAAPEQLGFMPEGEKVDARADLYAMAMVLFELLTGRPPYEATSPHEYFMLHAVEPRKQTVALPLDMPGGAALQAALDKALSRDRNQRYANAREFEVALEEIERTLPEPRDMPTMAMPIDGDETMRVISSKVDTLHRDAKPPAAKGGTQADTLHRETVRTQSPADPLPPVAPLTLLTPLPGDPAAIPPPTKLRAGISPAVVIIGFVAFLILAAVVLWMLPGDKKWGSIVSVTESAAPDSATTTTATTTTQAPPKIAEASVTVTSGTADSTQLSAPPVTTTTAITTTTPPLIAEVIPPPRTNTAPPKPIVTKPRETRPVETKPAEPVEDERDAEPAAPAFSRSATYRDGGDSDANDRAMAVLRRELRGTTTVALRAGGLTGDLARELREHFPDIKFEAEAAVVIRFNGRNDRLGAGRRRRYADAVVEKNGRVIFRYELPEETYRVGHNSVEAFASVLGEAFEE